MTPNEQEIAEAVGALKRAVRYSYGEGAPVMDADIDAALAILARCPRLVAVRKGAYVYVSRFKPGDEVWWLGQYWEKHPTMPSMWYMSEEHFHGVVVGADNDGVILDATNDDYYTDIITKNESDCFPTREEAEAEAERRNAERKD